LLVCTPNLVALQGQQRSPRFGDSGYVERRRSPDDRRLHTLYLTASGKRLLRKLSEVAHEHDVRLTAALGPEQ
jgi:DNA-binding MarR family transcriptional regulator